MEEIKIQQPITVEELIKKLDLNFDNVILCINNQVYYPAEVQKKQLQKGDSIKLLKIIAGG